MPKEPAKKSKDDQIKGNLRRVDNSKLTIVEQGDTKETQIEHPTPQQIYSELQKSECTLYFYKKTDGTMRRMRCTLNEGAFSTKYRTNKQLRGELLSYFSSGKQGKPGLVAVWDLDAHTWRSFYLNRVYKLVRNEQTEAE